MLSSRKTGLMDSKTIIRLRRALCALLIRPKNVMSSVLNHTEKSIGCTKRYSNRYCLNYLHGSDTHLYGTEF